MTDLESLMERWLQGELDGDEASTLADICREQPEVRQRLAAMLESERMLQAMSKAEMLDQTFCAEVDARIAMESGRLIDFDDSESARRIIARVDTLQTEVPAPHWHLPARWIGIAASIALLAGLALLHAIRTPRVAGESLATITAAEGVVWENAPADSRISAGTGEIALRRGYLELELSNKTKLLIEAPARFAIKSPMLMEVRSGKVVAEVPPAAVGFRVVSPDAEIIDLSTRFGVEVKEGGQTEVHVLKGKVKARAALNNSYQELGVNQAITTGDDGRNAWRVPGDPDRFLGELPDRINLGTASSVHWSFDEGSGNAARAEAEDTATAQAAEAHLRHLDRSAAGLDGGPSWTEGVFGSALSFDGRGSYLQTDFHGLSGPQPRTLAFWVKTDPDTPPGYAIFGWGSFEKGRMWQVSVNPDENDGPLGGLRLGVLDQTAVCGTDLRDGRWHHCAIVMYPGTLTDPTSPKKLVLFYIDGELENANRHTFTDIDTNASTDALPVTIGITASKKMGPTFRGCLDEVLLLDKPLSQQEIRNLMRANRLTAD